MYENSLEHKYQPCVKNHSCFFFIQCVVKLHLILCLTFGIRSIFIFYKCYCNTSIMSGKTSETINDKLSPLCLPLLPPLFLYYYELILQANERETVFYWQVNWHRSGLYICLLHLLHVWHCLPVFFLTELFNKSSPVKSVNPLLCFSFFHTWIWFCNTNETI